MIISRKFEKADWDVERILEILGDELQARERLGVSKEAGFEVEISTNNTLRMGSKLETSTNNTLRQVFLQVLRRSSFISVYFAMVSINHKIVQVPTYQTGSKFYDQGSMLSLSKKRPCCQIMRSDIQMFQLPW